VSPLELVLFGALCYLFGLVSGAVLIPWLVDRVSSRSTGMAPVSDERRAPNDYRWARQVAALLLIAVVVGASSWIDRQHRGHPWVTAVIRRLPR
jgi:hypothetical protein